jgi:SSS family transporter
MHRLNLNISPIDLGIVILYLVGVVAFGLWVGRGQKGMSDYLLGDRNLPLWLVLLSIVATETSTVTFLSVPGAAYKTNMTFLQLAMGYIVGRYAVVKLLLPLYFRGELFTAYQVLSQRFGGATKQAASLIFIVTRSLADGLRLFLTAIVLKIMLFPTSDLDTASFDTNLSLAVIIMGVTTIFYTVLGGMKAVVWTDAIQFFIYILGALVAGVVILARLPDGLNTLVEYGQSHGKFTLFDFRLDFTLPYTFWSGVIGGAFLSLGTHGADQLMVQRYLSARSQREAARALTASGWLVLAQFALFLLLGVGLAAFYGGREFARTDAVFATFIIEELPVGAVGLTLAAVFAAAMSTLSGSLNSLAAATVNDFYLPLTGRDPASSGTLLVTRLLTVLFGVVQIGVGIGGQFLTQSVVDNVLGIAGFTTGIVLGVFFLGVFTRRVGQQAALTALVGGLACMTLVWLKTPIAWPWYVLIGSSCTFAIGWLASFLLPRPPAEIVLTANHNP